MTPPNLRTLLSLCCGAALLTACPGDDAPPVNDTTGEDSTSSSTNPTNPTNPTADTTMGMTMSGTGSTSDSGSTTMIDPDTTAGTDATTTTATTTGTDSGTDTGSGSGSSSGSTGGSGSSGSSGSSSGGMMALDCEDVDLMNMLPVSEMGSTAMASNDFAPSCGGMDSNDFVYEWTAPADGTYSFDTFGSMYDTVLTLLSDCAGTEIACSDDILPALGGFPESRIVVDLMAGQSILVSVDGNATGDFVMNINEVLFDGYGDCVMSPYEQACQVDEVCITDGMMPPGLGVCSEFGCANDADCAPSPGGTAVAGCIDVTGDMMGECILNCANGATCPMGMMCVPGPNLCVWPG